MMSAFANTPDSHELTERTVDSALVCADRAHVRHLGA